jgi:peptidoglycan/LPS O-acetylase OafA/YrhL
LIGACVLTKWPGPQGDTIAAKVCSFALSPLLGLAFFVIVNAMTKAELGGSLTSLFTRFWARIGLFSYSLYLTHELIVTRAADLLASIMGRRDLEPLIGFASIPAAIGLGWVYFLVVEQRFIPSPRVKKLAL